MKKIYSALGVVSALLLVFFFFAPAFSGRIFVPPTVDLGGFTLRWYGIVLATAVLTGFFIARKFSWRFGIDKKEVEKLLKEEALEFAEENLKIVGEWEATLMDGLDKNEKWSR